MLLYVMSKLLYVIVMLLYVIVMLLYVIVMLFFVIDMLLYVRDMLLYVMNMLLYVRNMLLYVLNMLLYVIDMLLYVIDMLLYVIDICFLTGKDEDIILISKWMACLYRSLDEFHHDDTILPTLKTQHFFPLSDGELVSLHEKVVFYPIPNLSTKKQKGKGSFV